MTGDRGGAPIHSPAFHWSPGTCEKSEKEHAIKEKEILQKKMDEMQAQLDLAHAKVGDVVSVDSTITASAGKVRLKPL